MDIGTLGFYSKTVSTYFAIIGPIDVAILFAILTVKIPPQQQRRIALKGCLTACCILLFFAFFGNWLIQSIGISISAIKISGGLLLMLLAYQMIYGDISVDTNITADKKDISVFPLGTPLLAGAGGISATMIYTAGSSAFSQPTLITILAFVSVLILTYVLFIIAGQLQKVINPIFMEALTKVMGILLMALAVQFVLDGLQQAGVF